MSGPPFGFPPGGGGMTGLLRSLALGTDPIIRDWFSNQRTDVINALTLSQQDLTTPADGADMIAVVAKIKRTSLSSIGSYLPKAKGKGELRSLTSWWLSGKDADFEEVWPARNKVDLSIRRTRSRDLWLYLTAHRKWQTNVRALYSALRGDFDYISVLTLGWAVALIGDAGKKWVDLWISWGAFDDGVGHFALVAKSVNNILMTRDIHDDDRWFYLQCGGLVGYRNLPFPGFDIWKESQALAEGGEEHDWFGGRDTFSNMAARVLDMDIPVVPWMSFDEFVAKAEWLTGGSSSIGKLTVRIGEETIKIKARKNFVLDVVTPQELIEAVNKLEGQSNVTLVKSELGKVRLAVASDIETYLMMTWVTRMLGGAYTQWFGSTIEEDASEQYRRMFRMLSLCRRMIGLPYDYASFDHQPTTDELLMIVDILLRYARRNVPQVNFAEFDEIAGKIRKGFFNSTLTTRYGEEKRTWQVRGGLMSGLRWTSILGNAWNTVVTTLAIYFCFASGMSQDDIESYVRGDDSAIFTTSPSQAQLIEYAYRRMGVKGGVGKFSVRVGEMEFLRVFFSDRCRGYIMRAIPGLVQRKPWSSVPWDEANSLKSLREVCSTINRRGGDGEGAWTAISRHWANLHRIPVALISMPSQWGGLGLGRWDGSVVSPSFPRVRRPEMHFENMTEFRLNRVLEKCEKYRIPLTREQAGEVAVAELGGVVAADDVPGVSKVFRDLWKKELKGLSFSVRKYSEPVTSAHWLDLPRIPFKDSSYDDARDWVKRNAALYGASRWAMKEVLDVKPLLSKVGMTLRQYIRERIPTLDIELKALGSGHISELIDWAFGEFSVATTSIHPMLNGLVSGYCAARAQQNRRRGRKIAWLMNVAAGAVETHLLGEEWVDRVMSW